MTDEGNVGLQERVTRLEENVRRLEATIKRFSKTPASLPAGTPPYGMTRPGKPVPRGARIPEQLKDPRYWFRVLGIGLLLLGTVFIFKYSEDEGRGLMALRISIGMAMGGGLIGIGHRLRHSERHFSSVLYGGGIGVWYITGFAAFQLFALVPALPAFAFMTAVTVFAFMVALRHNVVALSVIAALGGLGTPWLLYETDRALAGPVAYMCLVLAGAMAVYARKGWKHLLWSSAGIAGVTFVAIGAQYYVDEGIKADRLTLQMGVAFYWLLFAMVAVYREVCSPSDVGSAHAEVPAPSAKKLLVPGGDIPMFVTLVPIYGVGLAAGIWEPNLNVAGWMGLVAAIVYAAAWHRLERLRGRTALSQAHLLASIVLVTMSVTCLLDGEVLIATLATEAAALHVLAQRMPARLMPTWAHIVYALIGLSVLGRVMVDHHDGLPIINSHALANLWVIVSGAAASFVLKTPNERFTYRYAAHGLILLWVLRELHDLPNGQGIVTIVWGVYAIALVVAGLRVESAKLRSVGLITLFAVVLKLVAVDLSELKAIWRVLLFSGFGAVLLGLSHWVQRFGKSEPQPPPNG
jgi:uncharacterized membrane protein